MVVLTVSLLTLIYLSIRSAGQMYYFKYYVGNEGLASRYMVAGTAATMAGVLLTGPLTRILDKKPLFMLCLVVIGLSAVPMYWFQPQQIGLIFAAQIVFSFASGPVMPLLWSMMGDIADYSEWKNGRRATGLVFSASVMSNKAGSAVGGAVAMYLLSLYHYQPNVAQTDEVLRGIRQMMSFHSAAGAALCMAVLCFYPINARLMNRIADEMKARKAGSQARA
jgi:GPH family glycoside/pentoside/hexuronide:cation symporter